MRAVRAPGLDRPPESPRTSGLYRPGNGAGGLFANFLQGQTPKYAINNGYRSDFYRNTMARMFVRVDAAEMDLFRASIADSHTQRNLASRIAGDPRVSGTRGRRTAGSDDPTVRRNANVHSNGYLDFLIQQIQMPLQEKVQISETLNDGYVLFAFGQSPPIWTFSGVLLNTVQDDQASNMFRLYTQILRATQLARRQKSMSLSFDSYVVNGSMMNLNLAMAAQNELYMQFSFQLVVKRVFITNFTAGWTPTRAGTPFAADLNAIAYDGRPRELQSLSRIAARTPNGTEPLAPVASQSADNRTTLASTPSITQELADAQRPLVLLPQTNTAPLPEFVTVQNSARPETVVSTPLNRSVP